LQFAILNVMWEGNKTSPLGWKTLKNRLKKNLHLDVICHVTYLLLKRELVRRCELWPLGVKIPPFFRPTGLKCFEEWRGQTDKLHP
jgi:hypothetical protein